MFLDTAGKPEGIVEVVQDCDTIFSLVSQMEHSNPDIKVTVYNSRHEKVYPYMAQSSSENYYAMKSIAISYPPKNGQSHNHKTETPFSLPIILLMNMIGP